MRCPRYRFDATDPKGPGQRAEQRYDRRDGEGPEIVAGAAQDEAGQSRSHRPAQISHEVLDSRPTAGRARARQRLGDGPNVGGTDAKRRSDQYHHYRRDSGAGQNTGHHEDRGARHTDAREALAHEGGSRPSGNPAVGKPAARGRDESADNVSRSHYARHLVHGKISAANEVSRHPGKEEIRQVVQASQSRAGAPSGAQLQDFENARSFFLRTTGGRVFDAVGRHPLEPRQEPDQAEETEDKEKRAPTIAAH